VKRHVVHDHPALGERGFDRLIARAPAELLVDVADDAVGEALVEGVRVHAADVAAAGPAQRGRLRGGGKQGEQQDDQDSIHGVPPRVRQLRWRYSGSVSLILTPHARRVHTLADRSHHRRAVGAARTGVDDLPLQGGATRRSPRARRALRR
jgi:hypothetical protein